MYLKSQQRHILQDEWLNVYQKSMASYITKRKFLIR